MSQKIILKNSILKNTIPRKENSLAIKCPGVLPTLYGKHKLP